MPGVSVVPPSSDLAGPRLDFAEVDFFGSDEDDAPSLPRGDLYVLSRILHDWSDSAVRGLFVRGVSVRALARLCVACQSVDICGTPLRRGIIQPQPILFTNR